MIKGKRASVTLQPYKEPYSGPTPTSYGVGKVREGLRVWNKTDSKQRRDFNLRRQDVYDLAVRFPETRLAVSDADLSSIGNTCCPIRPIAEGLTLQSEKNRRVRQ